MDYSDAAKVYISYEDHCSVVAECRRLLDELKCKYELERQKMATTIDCLRDQLEGVKLESQLWRKKFTAAHVFNEEADRNSKKWAERVLEREKKIVRLRGELRETLKCLEELVEYVEAIKEDNYRNSKQRIKDKTITTNWISQYKRQRQKLNRTQQRFQGRVSKLRRKQSLLRVKLSRIKARYGRRIRSLLGRIDLLTAENQRLEIELREIVRQHEIRARDEDEDEDGIGLSWTNRRPKERNRPKAKQTTSRYR